MHFYRFISILAYYQKVFINHWAAFMSDQLQHELKKEFQLERMILFSDAIFAIAITLLVLDIRVPSIDRHIATDKMLIRSLDEMIPKFIGFILSFFLIGLYWMIHHRMFGYVIDYTPKLLRLNLLFLFAVVVMPFSTAFYSEYVLHFLVTPMIVYVSNIVLLGITNLLLWIYIGDPKRKLISGINPGEIRFAITRAVTVPLVFVAMAILYLTTSPQYAVILPIIIPVIMKIIRKKQMRKFQPATK